MKLIGQAREIVEQVQIYTHPASVIVDNNEDILPGRSD